MRKAGFTLIEIIVVMTILSILAGVMTPMLYKVWDEQKYEQTRERMLALKIAIAGDQRLYQNGIRSDYGFVGEAGDLPDSLDDLTIDSATKFDLWGNAILYTRQLTPLEVDGQSLAATLRSSGPDGRFDTSDDIDENTDLSVQILSLDVWPAEKVVGNWNIILDTSNPATTSYFFNLKIAGKDDECFKVLDTGSTSPDYPDLNITLAPSLPIGAITLTRQILSGSCSGTIEKSVQDRFFIIDGLKELYVNPRALYYRIP